MTEAAQQKASAAALRATGGGTVLVVTRDPTEHAAYAVDVREASDQIVEVRLDRNYRPIATETLQSPNDGGDGGD